MGKNILDLLYELKKKCIINDDTFMSKANLTQAEYHFFIAISSCDEINSNTVAKKMDLSLSRISRVIDKLVNRKYLIRKTNTSDRRAIKLTLTKDGKELKKQIEEYRNDCELKIIKNVSTEELDLIKKSFNTILELL
jgi:DNA-binding MarR family transcriptional regulator